MTLSSIGLFSYPCNEFVQRSPIALFHSCLNILTHALLGTMRKCILPYRTNLPVSKCSQALWVVLSQILMQLLESATCYCCLLLQQIKFFTCGSLVQSSQGILYVGIHHICIHLCRPNARVAELFLYHPEVVAASLI